MFFEPTGKNTQVHMFMVVSKRKLLGKSMYTVDLILFEAGMQNLLILFLLISYIIIRRF